MTDFRLAGGSRFSSDDNALLLQLNTLACNPTCVNSLWTIFTDGSNLTKIADGTFETLVGGQ